MTTVTGQSHGWYLICAFCRKHKSRDSDVCGNCGATVKVEWEIDLVVSPELVMVMRG